MSYRIWIPISIAQYIRGKRPHIRLFPDHCEKNAIAIIILSRFLFPGVLIKLNQPTFAATSRSNLMAALISSNSYSTRGSLLKKEE